jgi:hypothetical protein
MKQPEKIIITCYGGYDTQHDRDHSAAINLKPVVTGTTSPMANSTGNGDAETVTDPVSAGKVTSIRCTGGQEDRSGQKKNREHFLDRRTRSLVYGTTIITPIPFHFFNQNRKKLPGIVSLHFC